MCIRDSICTVPEESKLGWDDSFLPEEYRDMENVVVGSPEYFEKTKHWLGRDRSGEEILKKKTFGPKDSVDAFEMVSEILIEFVHRTSLDYREYNDDNENSIYQCDTIKESVQRFVDRFVLNDYTDPMKLYSNNESKLVRLYRVITRRTMPIKINDSESLKGGHAKAPKLSLGGFIDAFITHILDQGQGLLTNKVDSKYFFILSDDENRNENKEQCLHTLLTLFTVRLFLGEGTVLWNRNNHDISRVILFPMVYSQESILKHYKLGIEVFAACIEGNADFIGKTFSDAYKQIEQVLTQYCKLSAQIEALNNKLNIISQKKLHQYFKRSQVTFSSSVDRRTVHINIGANPNQPDYPTEYENSHPDIKDGVVFIFNKHVAASIMDLLTEPVDRDVKRR